MRIGIHQSVAAVGFLAAGMLASSQLYADVVHNDDTIVIGSHCVGLDCVNGENFGFDTIRLKENNLRIHFDDTSTAASFPRNDWRIRINDSANGGASYFAVEDATAGRTPFRVDAGAPNNSLRVDGAGDVGIGVDNPVVELHLKDGDTPTVRLEQDNSSGFTPQTWDMAGNETNFFVRDVTNGSKLPFRIRPNAPTNSIFIDNDGDVGLGTSSPSARLDVVGSANVQGSATITSNSGSTELLVEDTSATVSSRTMLSLENNGASRLRFIDNSMSLNWNMGNRSTGSFSINLDDGAGLEFDLDADGNLTTEGLVNGSSDKNRKKNVVEIDARNMLERVRSLPLAEWSYKDARIEARHYGPMAQDFYSIFGLGINDVTIAPADMAGVSLAAIKALDMQLRAKDAEIGELRKRLTALEAALETPRR